MILTAFVGVFLMLHYAWPYDQPLERQQPPSPVRPRHQHSNAPIPLAGLIYKLYCALCEQEASYAKPPPPIRSDPVSLTTRRLHEVDTARHFCPHAICDHRGWLELGSLHANGHPSGGPWHQFRCASCGGYFPEHQGSGADMSKS
jgi:hypothetical protein